MSKRTLLLIASWLQLLVAAYCVLAFVAWSAKLFLLPEHRNSSDWLLLVPVILAAACFVLYPRTRKRIDRVD
jgi:hypothetical protein